MLHRYDQSSEYEKFWQPIADEFYTSKYPKCELKRYNSNSKEDLEFQKKDIDLTIVLPDRNIHISEKFRKDDYGDLLIELFSKYPDVKGWMNNSAADYITYFTPHKVYVINKLELLNWYQTENFEDKINLEISNFHTLNERKSSRKKIEYTSSKGHSFFIHLIQAYNKTMDAEWHTLSLAISWNELEKEGIQVKKYPI
jgi:hypothetical protein